MQRAKQIWNISLHMMVLQLLLQTARCVTPLTTNSTEYHLRAYLFKNYDRLVWPDQTLPIDVIFGMELIHLVNVEERNHQITTNVWIRQSWTNQLLRWNSSEWNGITTLSVGGTDVWVPDIVLYNNAEKQLAGGVERYKTQITMHDTGLQTWLAPAVFKTMCKFDVKYFPFDSQTCIMKFGSWTHDRGAINIISDNRTIITSQFVNSSEWEIPSIEHKINVIQYTCCENPFVDISFTIALKRKPLFYWFNVILPCLILSLTILFGFFFPAESGERISLTITVLLAITFFLQTLTHTLPVNSDSVPRLAVFYMVVMIESALSLGATCVVLVVHHRSKEDEVFLMPKWVQRCFIDFIGKRLLGIHEVNGASTENKLASGIGFIEKDCRDSSVRFTCNIRYTRRRRTTKNNHKSEKRGSSRNVRSAESISVHQIRHDLQSIVSIFEKKDRVENLNKKWRLLGKILDRLFSMIFFCTISLSAVCILAPTK